MNNAINRTNGEFHPRIIVNIFDQSVPVHETTPIFSTSPNGDIIMLYQNHLTDGTVGFSDPLSMAIAQYVGDEKQVGQVIGRITGNNEEGPFENFRVIFQDGPGMVVSRPMVKIMREIFIGTPGLVPIVVQVVVPTTIPFQEDSSMDEGVGGDNVPDNTSGNGIDGYPHFNGVPVPGGIFMDYLGIL